MEGHGKKDTTSTHVETTLDVFIVYVALNVFWCLCYTTLVAFTSSTVRGQRLGQSQRADELPGTWIPPGAMEMGGEKNSCATDPRRVKGRDWRSVPSQNTSPTPLVLRTS